MDRELSAVAGRTIEQIVARQIQERYAVVLTANIETSGRHGPRLEGGNVTTAITSLADFQFYGKRHGWMEVKAKSRANHWRIRDRDEHGIDANKFEEYCRLQVETGLPVYLLICEYATGTLLMADVNTLRTSGVARADTWPGNGKRAIHFDRRAFSLVGTFSAPNDDLTRLSIAWDWDALNSFLSQMELFSDY